MFKGNQLASRRSYIFGLFFTLALVVALALPASTAFALAPVNTVPSAQTLGEDTTLVFSEENLNPISVSDVDAGEGNLQVTLTATNGMVSLGAASVTITDSIEEINSALEGVSFTPALDFVGPASLSITTNDLDL